MNHRSKFLKLKLPYLGKSNHGENILPTIYKALSSLTGNSVGDYCYMSNWNAIFKIRIGRTPGGREGMFNPRKEDIVIKRINKFTLKSFVEKLPEGDLKNQLQEVIKNFINYTIKTNQDYYSEQVNYIVKKNKK